MHEPVSPSFSLNLHLQKRFGSRSDPNGIQERMFRELKKLFMCDRKYTKCLTKADAHDKMGFQYISISVYIVRSHARIQRGDRGSGAPPLKNHKNIEFLSNTGQDPLKFSKLPSQHSTLGYHRHASEATFKAFRLRTDDGPLLVIFGSSLLQKRCQSSDPDQIRMEFRKECFVNLKIWA